MTTYNFAQIEQLWLANGGQPNLAPTMAAIALAESGGNSQALNNNPATGDYSVGLWQINYYGNLLGSRTATYGPPSYLQANPDAQAKAAVALAAGGRGLGNWTTYTSGRYQSYLQGGAAGAPQQASATPAQVTSSNGASWAENFLNAIAPGSGLLGGGNPISAADRTFKILEALTQPVVWLRIAEVVAGAALMGIGAAMYINILVPGVGGIVATVAGGPTGLAGRAVSQAGQTRRANVAQREQTSRARISEELKLQRQQESAQQARYRAGGRGTTHRGPGDRSRPKLGHDTDAKYPSEAEIPADEYFF